MCSATGYGADARFSENQGSESSGSREVGGSGAVREVGAPKAEAEMSQVSVVWQREHCPIGWLAGLSAAWQDLQSW